MLPNLYSPDIEKSLQRHQFTKEIPLLSSPEDRELKQALRKSLARHSKKLKEIS